MSDAGFSRWSGHEAGLAVPVPGDLSVAETEALSGYPVGSSGVPEVNGVTVARFITGGCLSEYVEVSGRTDPRLDDVAGVVRVLRRRVDAVVGFRDVTGLLTPLVTVVLCVVAVCAVVFADSGWLSVVVPLAVAVTGVAGCVGYAVYRTTVLRRDSHTTYSGYVRVPVSDWDQALVSVRRLTGAGYGVPTEIAAGQAVEVLDGVLDRVIDGRSGREPA